jgi:hypothetical protein
MTALSPIFVAGTGRSGTSQPANILGEHILTVRLAGSPDTDRGYTVPAAIGVRHYWDALGWLWSQLVAPGGMRSGPGGPSLRPARAAKNWTVLSFQTPTPPSAGTHVSRTRHRATRPALS